MTPTTAEPVSDDRWTFPVRVDINLSVLDCSSRLLSTIRARTYDKVRRAIDTVPLQIRRFFKDAGLPVPAIHLRILGLNSIVVGFSSAEILAVCHSVENAATDCDVDRVQLLEIDVAGGARYAHDISMIPDLLTLCPASEIVLQLASSVKGANARDLYAASLILLMDDFEADLGARLILACNASDRHLADVFAVKECFVDASFSAWPLLSELRDELPSDACYTDRLLALGFVGEKVYGQGKAVLRDLVHSLNSSEATTVPVRIGQNKISINAVGEGPSPAGIWAGLPVSSYADASSSSIAALFLRNGLMSEINTHRSSTVETDDLPLSFSIRNIHAVAPCSSPPPDSGVDDAPANLAGYLFRMFSQAVERRTCQCVRIVTSVEGFSEHGTTLDGIPGTIPFVPQEQGWAPSHFSGGGLLLAPSGTKL